MVSSITYFKCFLFHYLSNDNWAVYGTCLAQYVNFGSVGMYTIMLSLFYYIEFQMEMT